MKTWIFRETGEVRKPKKGEWVFLLPDEALEKAQSDFEVSKFPILSLEVHESDPMEGIRVVYNKYKDNKKSAFVSNFRDYLEFMRYELWQAIKEAMEGK